MSSTEAIKIGMKQWRKIEGIDEYLRGESEGLCSLWNNQEVIFGFFFLDSKLDISQVQKYTITPLIQHFQFVYATQLH